MKKVVIIALLVLVASVVIAEESSMFVKTVQIKQVYPLRLGYRILYLKANLEFEEIYVPIRWADQAGGKAEIYFGDDPSYPYFSIFYDKGEFMYIRLYLHENRRHETWGQLKLTNLYDRRFDIEDLAPVFE